MPIPELATPRVTGARAQQNLTVPGETSPAAGSTEQRDAHAHRAAPKREAEVTRFARGIIFLFKM